MAYFLAWGVSVGSGDLADDLPALERRFRAALLNTYDIAGLVGAGFVMRVILLAATDGLAEGRMRETAFDFDHDGLGALVAHHDALQDAFGHLCLLIPLRGLRRRLLLQQSQNLGDGAPHLADAV